MLSKSSWFEEVPCIVSFALAPDEIGEIKRVDVPDEFFTVKKFAVCEAAPTNSRVDVDAPWAVIVR
jgi:hypothetical protein